MEWSDSNKYNPFNSMKGLLWNDSHYKPIRAWFRGEGTLSPPVELSLDPIHACNFKCPHCNAQRYLRDSEYKEWIMGWEDLADVVALAGNWGVKGVCVGGGGEPLTNRNVCHEFGLMSRIYSHHMESAIATNGFLINEFAAEELVSCCKWVAISVDAASRETFKKVHGVDGFKKVIDNIDLLVKTKKETGSSVHISYRFLIVPDNYKDIRAACRIASITGVDSFHARPADLERGDVVVNGRVPDVSYYLDKCHEQETDTFKVQTTTHKFDSDFKAKHNFKNCVAAPLVWQACADGNSYVCPDHRLESRFRMCKNMDTREYWGSDAHRELLQSINVDKECSRCTWSEYARQIEVLADDPTHRNFP